MAVIFTLKWRIFTCWSQIIIWRLQKLDSNKSQSFYVAKFNMLWRTRHLLLKSSYICDQDSGYILACSFELCIIPCMASLHTRNVAIYDLFDCFWFKSKGAILRLATLSCSPVAVWSETSLRCCSKPGMEADVGGGPEGASGGSSAFVSSGGRPL